MMHNGPLITSSRRRKVGRRDSPANGVGIVRRTVTYRSRQLLLGLSSRKGH
jgi:hypothetical protein